MIKEGSHVPQSRSNENVQLAGVALIFIVLLHEHATYILVGFHNTLNDLHPFRQTQTALSAYYLKITGFRLDYLTPVAGAPWSVPFEFPLYQFIMMEISRVFSIGLNEAGRLTSIGFLYGSVAVLFRALKHLQFSRTERLIVCSAVLVNPVLLFWGRTVMIETTAVFFSLVYLTLMLRGFTEFATTRNVRYILLAFAALAGSIAALVKITTFVVFFVCANLFVLYTWLKNRRQVDFSIVIKQGLKVFLFGSVIPIAVGYTWTSYADRIKRLSYLGSQLTSSKLQHWNFGTLHAKFSPDTWVMIDNNCGHYLLISVGLTCLAFLVKLPHRFLMLIFTLAGISGPLFFTNLYWVHDYYSSANVLVLSVTVGLFAVSIFERRAQLLLSVPAVLLILTVAVYSTHNYLDRYFGPQSYNNDSIELVSHEITRLTSPDDVILVVGRDWSSEIPYYSERKAICIPDWIMPELNGNTAIFLEKLKSSNITAFAALEHQANFNETNSRIIEYFGFSPTPYSLAGGYCLLFKKKNE